MAVRVLIADDHAVVRDGLRMIIESHDDLAVAGAAADGNEAISMAGQLAPDVVIMDIAMPELNGIEAARAITAANPEVRVIMLSMYHTAEHVYRAMQAGAKAYILKESAGSEVITAIRSVMGGGCFFGSGVEDPSHLPEPRRTGCHKGPLESLSQREREVLQLVVEGKTSAEIAAVLSLSPKSVETYRSRLMRKLGVDNIPSLVKYAVALGLTPPA